MYDVNNVFAKIIRGEIPCKRIAEDEYFLSFYDIKPKAPIHALVIPNGAYENAHDFTGNALPEEIVGFWKGVNTTINILSLSQNGYRLVVNNGKHSHQEVLHFHVHILGGHDLGPKHAMTTFTEKL